MKNLALPCPENQHVMEKFSGHLKLQANELMIFQIINFSMFHYFSWSRISNVVGQRGVTDF